MINKTVLDNGVRVVSSSMKDAQSLAVGVWIDVGNRNETPDVAGISHYLEHLVFKGTKHYSCQQIKEAIEGVGGSFNGFTSEEATCYLVKMPAQYLDVALKILTEMVSSPSLTQEDIDKERTVILEEIKMYKDLPQGYVHELLDELLWPRQPLGRSILGTVESVTNIRKQDLDAYRAGFYTAPNIVVSAAGRLSHRTLCVKAGKLLRGSTGSRRNIPSPARISQDKPQARIFHKETEQTHFVLGFHGLHKAHPQRHALGLLNVILGGNSSSRLFNEIREKRGLAYEIGTAAKRLKDTGAFLVHAGVDNAKVVETLRLVFKELDRARQDPVSPGEFRRAKEFFLGQLTLALEDTMDQMLWLGDSVVSLDKTYSLRQMITEVNKVSARDVRETARLIFKDSNLNLALIGPQQQAQDQILKQLYLG